MDISTDKYRDQAGVIPFRRRNGKLEVCVITSMRKGNWGFPKGNVDPCSSSKGAALREAEEEAGLHGTIVGDQLGAYRYKKRGGDFRVTAYLMKVDRTELHWCEATLRERRWVPADEALKILSRGEWKQLLSAALERLP